MPWAGLDDGFHDDPRIVEAGLAAAGLYACMTTYCARYLTDGEVPRKIVGRLLEDGDMAPLDALLGVGMVVDGEGCYRLPEYLSAANKPRAWVEDNRRKAAERKAKAREARAERRGSGEVEAVDDIPF